MKIKLDSCEKSITVLGSTGSVGRQALEVARKLNLKVCGLSASSDIALLEEQIREFGPEVCAVADQNAARELKIKTSDTKTKILSGDGGVADAASYQKSDIVLNAIGGVAGLKSTLSVIEAGKTLALANKESLVAAGSIVMKLAEEKNVDILPVDSEHSAIFQCLSENNNNLIRHKNTQSGEKTLKSIILTASGGPFFGKSSEELQKITPSDALRHPTWKMGRKITIDSATLMNKGLEVIEAVHLYGVEPKKIRIVVHRESVIHSMVEYTDNVIIAQLGVPDMRSCIQYAITYPHRLPGLSEPLDFAKYGSLSFHEPDYDTFYLLKTAYKAIERGGNIPAAMNGANEKAVELFLEGKISFTDIFRVVTEVTENFKLTEKTSLDDIYLTDREARFMAAKVAEKTKQS